MPIATLLLPLIIAAPEAIAIDPCHAISGESVIAQGPGPSETNVPLNTSLWLTLLDAPASTLDVTLTDTASNTPVAVHQEILFHSAFETALRVHVDQLLLPSREYSVAWAVSDTGRSGGFNFRTGTARDDIAPAPPTVDNVEGAFARLRCYESYGLSIRVRSSSESADLIHLVSEGAVLRGLGRGETLKLIHGAADAHVTASLVAMDLAGNRSRTSAAVEGDTPESGATTQGGDSGGCSTAPPSSLMLFAVSLALMATARRQRRS